jgi:hypothetical protein
MSIYIEIGWYGFSVPWPILLLLHLERARLLMGLAVLHGASGGFVARIVDSTVTKSVAAPSA